MATPVGCPVRRAHEMSANQINPPVPKGISSGRQLTRKVGNRLPSSFLLPPWVWTFRIRAIATKSINSFAQRGNTWRRFRSEEHTSELQSLMRISYAVFCLKKKQQK